jgi:hypothetical protein
MAGVPLERDPKLGQRARLTQAEFEARQKRLAEQVAEDNSRFDAEHPAATPTSGASGQLSPPPHWLERGQPQYQASLIVDPPNGRMPPLTQAAERRQAALRKARERRGPADSYTDLSLADRCITRGLVGSLTPALNNAGNEIVQAPGFVVIRNEMIHEARVVPVDGGAHVAPAIEGLLGDSRGHWEGDTLVVETTNFTDRTKIGNVRHSGALKVVERYTRIADREMDLEITIDDPETWTAPWTIDLPLARDDGYGMYEYACHEGNLAIANILRAARAEERAPLSIFSFLR